MPNIIKLTPSLCGCSPIQIGFRVENDARTIEFDFTEWADEYGSGAVELLVRRKGDQAAYPVALEIDGMVATWNISDTDTSVPGYGKAEYTYTVGTTLAKTAVFTFFVAEDLADTTQDPPDPYQTWVDTLTSLGAETLGNAIRAEDAADRAEDAQANAETAEQTAEGHATNAAQSAGAARDMAASALSSADRATASATAASGHATAAETAKDLAISAAESAQHSETQAELSASAASESATAAAQSATNAASSATSASGSASAAATSESNAAQSATSAAASATEAATEAAKLNNYLPTDTASGAIASFSDGADGVPVEALSIALEPVQSGSGTPSPDNIRPITGHTACEVWRAGVNVWDEEWENGYLGIDGTNVSYIASSSRIRSKNWIPVVVGETYYYNGGGYGSFVIGAEDTNGTNAVLIISSDSSGFTFTPTRPFIKFAPRAGYGGTYNSNISVNYPNTDHAYHAHSIANISIPLGQTVYGGTPDVVQGVCTVDRAMVTVPTSAIRTTSTSGLFFCDIGSSGEFTADAKNISNAFVYSMSSGISAGQCYMQSGFRVQMQTNYASLADFVAALGSNSLEFCFVMSSPIEIQLTAHELTTLLGQNNVWSDSGDVSVEYRADIQKYISKVIAEAIS